MMLYQSTSLSDKYITAFPKPLSIHDPKAFYSDHMLSMWHYPGDDDYSGSSRGKKAEFVQTSLLYGDIDNTHSDNPSEWVTLETFTERYKAYTH